MSIGHLFRTYRYVIRFVFFLPTALSAQSTLGVVYRGADLSSIQQIEDVGGKYYQNGAQKDPLDIFRSNGVNYVRLRLWHTPAIGYCGLAKTLTYAARVKAKGFKLLLDFHYSDTWADPGRQDKPSAWTGIPFSALKESVYVYTKYVVGAFKRQGTLPDMIQIGNEIIGGMLWPDGRISLNGWQPFADLVKQGIRGVKDTTLGDTVRIMIHIDRGGDNAGARWFFDSLLAQGVAFDVIGLSYYPWWHGSLTQVKNNLNDLATRYNKDLVIVETAYPWTLSSQDTVTNIVGSSGQLQPGYPATVKGQKDFLFALEKILHDTINKRGIGFIYWEPGYISVAPTGSPWENCAMFDSAHASLNSLTAFNNLDTLKSVSVTVRASTASLGDTLTPGGTVQLRGEVQGICSNVLPSGDAVTWDGSSQILFANAGGDNWQYQFRMFSADILQFKFWTGYSLTFPTSGNLGWEGPVTPYDSSTFDGRRFVAGNSDTTLQVEFYNSSSKNVNQFWTPIPKKTDSAGVLFRVNVAPLMSYGLFDPNVNGPVSVRGDSAASAGVLSLSTDKLVLTREGTGIVNGTFWSGVAYFPKSRVSAGLNVGYKFYVGRSAFGGWESGIAWRSFKVPSNDTTLAWKFFNERAIPTGVEKIEMTGPAEVQLLDNYPNPFNPSTVITYTIPKTSHVSLTVYNILGQLTSVLKDQVHQAGRYRTVWKGVNDAGVPAGSGMYFVRLDVDGVTRVRRVVLLK